MTATVQRRPRRSLFDREDDEIVLADLRPLESLRRKLPGKPALRTVRSWAKRGLLGRDGEAHVLRTVRVGGRLFSSERWCTAFVEEVS